tara:strand:- start:16 stop:384 length:369 start_codon:yes stop_codon:yes gene_type:complete
MENYKFEKLIEKALKDKIFGNDEHEYMQYHPENIKGDILGVTKAKLSKEQKIELEEIWKIKQKEFLNEKKKIDKDSKELHRSYKPFYWIIGIFILMAILFGNDYGSGPGEFHDALRSDDAKR